MTVKPILQALCMACLMATSSAQAATPIIEQQIDRLGERLPELDELTPEIDADELQLHQLSDQQLKQKLEEIDSNTLMTLDPMSALPEVLEIKDATGQVVLREELVEDGARAVANQWLLMLDEKQQQRLATIGATIIEQQQYAGLGLELLLVEVPAAYNDRATLKKALQLESDEQLGRNHIYEASQSAVLNKQTDSAPSRVKAVCHKTATIGLIDTAIDTEHQAFSRADIHSRNFLPPGLTAPTAHGTAVAGLLVGNQPPLTPLLPQARLVAASVFYQRNQYSQGATLLSLLEALNWLAEQQVRVVNMSLTGPHNPLLQQAVEKANERGLLIVAAVGNEGPAAKPRYPAAYTQVIGATAVDDKQAIYRWANQGDYVDFAAPGVSVLTARSHNQLGRESGTSIAAPQVAAFAYCYQEPGLSNQMLLQKLSQLAIDLGAAGKDPVYGFGLLIVE